MENKKLFLPLTEEEVHILSFHLELLKTGDAHDYLLAHKFSNKFDLGQLEIISTRLMQMYPEKLVDPE